jgi:hypothetical protein
MTAREREKERQREQERESQRQKTERERERERKRKVLLTITKRLKVGKYNALSGDTAPGPRAPALTASTLPPPFV